MKRAFDLAASIFGLLVLSPLLIMTAVWIAVSSKGGVFYRQVRVGVNNRDFKVFKFRSMYVDSDKKGLLTVGGADFRITPIGRFIRRYKIDELPQLINVLIGDMSLVGPRPEVRKYVDMYTDDQRQVVLSVRPGITDPASMKYYNENDILAEQANPEQYYIDVIMQDKLRINEDYINNRSFLKDILLIFTTVFHK